MLDKLLVSFKDNIAKNTRNPFLGSLILIWGIRNWKIVFALFADNRSFEKRLEFIVNELRATTLWEIVLQFGINVGLAILSVIVIYSLIYLTRYITNRFENQLLPEIYKRSAPKKIVLKAELDKAQEEKERLEQKLKVEKDRRIEAEAEVENLEKEKGDNFVQNLTTPAIEEKSSQNHFLAIENKIVEKYGKEVIEQNLSIIKNEGRMDSNSKNIEVIDDLYKLGFLQNRDPRGDNIYYKISKDGDALLRKLY